MLRWKLNPKVTGLASVFAGPRGSTLRDGETKYAMVDKTRGGGWYWVAGWESGVPHKNTAYEPAGTEAQAKADAMAYVRSHLK